MQQRGTHEAVPDRRNEDVLVYINGEFFGRAEARISVFDSGFLVGDGVWEGLRLHGGELAFLEEHLDRLFQGAKAIGIERGGGWPRVRGGERPGRGPRPPPTRRCGATA